MEKRIKEVIEQFMELVIKDLKSRYMSTEKRRWWFPDWHRGATWGLRRGEQIMRKRLRELK